MIEPETRVRRGMLCPPRSTCRPSGCQITPSRLIEPAFENPLYSVPQLSRSRCTVSLDQYRLIISTAVHHHEIRSKYYIGEMQ